MASRPKAWSITATGTRFTTAWIPCAWRSMSDHAPSVTIRKSGDVEPARGIANPRALAPRPVGLDRPRLDQFGGGGQHPRGDLPQFEAIVLGAQALETIVLVARLLELCAEVAHGADPTTS